MDDYNRGAHFKYSMKVHLIFVTKYRKRVFNNEVRVCDVKKFLYAISKKFNYIVIQMETDQDHVHILLEYCPNTSVSDIVKQLHIKCGNIMKTFCQNNIGNIENFGQTDILHVV